MDSSRLNARSTMRAQEWALCIRAGALCGALRPGGASNLVENQINLAAGPSPFAPCLRLRDTSKSKERD